MALPNPAIGIPPNAPSTNVPDIGDVKFDIKEAIQTGLKGGFLSAQQSFFSKVPKILGGGVLAERAELKKRELFEKQGRDPTTGRKLTKEELEERALRKRSYGIMGDISDSVQEIQRILESGIFGVGGGTARGSVSLGSLREFGKKDEIKIEQPKDGMGYELASESSSDNVQTSTLAMEEQQLEAQEVEKEQKLEIQERNEDFFVKLFTKFFGEKGAANEATDGSAQKEGSSLFSKIASAVDFIADAKSLGAGRLLGGAGRMLGIGRGAASAAGTATQGATTAANASKGFFGRAFDSVKSGASKAASKVGAGFSAAKSYAGKGISKVGEVASKLNPIKTLKTGVAKYAPKIFKGAVALPAIGAAMEGVLGGMEISNVKSDPMISPDEKKEKIGKLIGSTLGSIMGTIGGGALGTLIPIPGVGTIIGSIGGSYAGSLIGESLAEALGGKEIYDTVSSIPLLGDLIKVEDYAAPQTGVPSNAEELGVADNVMTPSTSTTKAYSSNMISAVPATIPATATTLNGLDAENSMLKSQQATPPAVVSSSNTVVNQSNNASVLSALSTTRTGADLNDTFVLRRQLGLAY